MSITTVVNLRKEPYDVYVGRAGHGEDGPFGNPIRAMEPCSECGKSHTPRETIPCFEKVFLRRVASDPTFRAKVLALKGKRLGCFCAPASCHADVIAAWVDGRPSPVKREGPVITKPVEPLPFAGEQLPLFGKPK